ncbi:RecQ family ATP-dependent DNA helicase [Silvania hatchlandensis]|uniref:ATP-dependent DNA helicase RecQ n=1 Tax=Silvania hatchlandensis TaxID=2926469 RepID=A0A9J6Q9A0_9ENTR|nr:RecQ family ATP-dependent DNA helicase [Silvania hatchlandensis]MCU6664997.1 RecQ family ATP-dependent DNA helicase [Silvania hatchlandensis]
MDKHGAESLLRQMLNNDSACFREGQWEAIDALVNQRRKLLVVQRTGWGKSAVYFIGTRIFRDRGFGPTIIVSPLLALMRNQVAAAERLGIRAETLNSTNRDDWQKITKRLLANQLDCLLISPERLANEEFVRTVLQPVSDSLGLLVVDEAHCISDWGHDFRPDYRRILGILRQLPANTPVLGTTATANNRVVEDIRQQLGDITILRGTLARESLALDAFMLADQPSRLAWMAQTIPALVGSGIVYTLTTRDAELVAAWLKQNGINACPYYSGVTLSGSADTHAVRERLEHDLLTNRIKVLVATTALGMGYDKADLGFVIHYQMPGSIVGYYQQVGRAGRAIEHAVGFLLGGTEDRAIHQFFHESAFPSEEQITEVLQCLERQDGMTIRDIETQTNLRHGQIEKVLKLLVTEIPSTVIFEDRHWRRTAIPFVLDRARIEHLTQQRTQELAEVEHYIHSKDCRMSFLRRALDEPNDERCGKCSNCLNRSSRDDILDDRLLNAAARFVKRADLPLILNKQVAKDAFVQYAFHGNLPREVQGQEGRILSRWGDTGWGAMVAADKRAGKFRDELVEACAEMIRERWQPNPAPAWVCCVPSRQHPNLVPDFARRLAEKLALPFVDAINKVVDNQPQKMQQNRFHQCKNLDGVFKVSRLLPKGPVLLVDDVVDSGWTLTVIAALMRQLDSEEVYPVALASTSVKNG